MHYIALCRPSPRDCYFSFMCYIAYIPFSVGVTGMASGIGNPLRAARPKSLITNNPHSLSVGTKLATSVSTHSRKGGLMKSVGTVATVPKSGTSFVRCPSCQAKIRRVDDFVARMIWDRFRCKCGYDGPLEYVANVGRSTRKLSGA
jgi:predicted RNA-binding Zn-ribbon protein involved in translation (DUF1610 family)